jgi:hypothetical protein
MKAKIIKGSWEAQKANRNSKKINLSEKDIDSDKEKKNKLEKKIVYMTSSKDSARACLA